MARHQVCRPEELPPGAFTLVPIRKRGIGVFNVNGEYHAVNNVCPHQGGPLCEGTLTGTTAASVPYEFAWVRDGEILSCPWHRWEIDLLTGRVLADPVKKVPKFKVWVEDGMVVLEA